MDEIELKQELLNGKKTDRIIFAVTPDLKRAVTEMQNGIAYPQARSSRRCWPKR